MTQRSAIICLTLIGGSLSAFTQNVALPRIPSPAASVSQTVGISTVTINYSRPSVKGRPVWGALIPYGWNKQPGGDDVEAPWRAGANENTTIQFTRDGTLEGKKVPAGTYGLFIVVNKDNTGEVVLSQDNRSWGNYHYNASHDLFRAPIAVQDGPMTETLTYSFDTPSKNDVKLLLSFEKKQFPLAIHFDTDDLVMENAAVDLKGVMGFGWQAYSTAANYAALNKVNTEQALGWIETSIGIQKNYTNLRVKSQLLAQSGKTAEAKTLMDEASTLASEAELNAYGYELMGENKPDEALAVLLLNTKKNPKSANVWDSLGEAYALRGDKKNAIPNFKKALSMNPPANTKANSEKYLAQLSK